MRIIYYLKLFRNIIIQHSILYSVKINSPLLVALILYLQSDKCKKKKKYQILYLAKPVFNDDVIAIQERSKKLNFKRFPRLSLSIICRFFLKEFDTLNDANYHVLIKESKEVKDLRDFLLRVIIIYRRFNYFDAVLAGNFVYTQQQELLIVLRKLKIPSIIIYKEGMLPIAKFESAKDFLYKTKVFRADHIMFYNKMIRDALVKTNMPGLDYNKTTVIGLPRFDKYFNHKSVITNNQIVLFSFEPNEKGNYLIDDKSKFNSFEKEVTKFHILFAQYCVLNKDYNLVVKTKGSDRAVNYAKKVYSPFIEKLGERLVISSSLNVSNLIKSSSYIAGFSSTTLIEGLALNKKIICPKFSRSILKSENDLLYPYQELGFYILKLSDLVSVFTEDNIINDKLKNQFIKERVYNDDGKSSLRAEQCIIDVITNF